MSIMEASSSSSTKEALDVYDFIWRGLRDSNDLSEVEEALSSRERDGNLSGQERLKCDIIRSVKNYLVGKAMFDEEYYEERKATADEMMRRIDLSYDGALEEDNLREYFKFAGEVLGNTSLEFRICSEDRIEKFAYRG